MSLEEQENKVTLKDLHKFASDVTCDVLAAIKLVVVGLSINGNPTIYSKSVYIKVYQKTGDNDKDRIDATVIVTRKAWDIACKEEDLTKETMVDIRVTGLKVADKSLNVMINANGIRKSGMSETEKIKQRVRKYCIERGYFDRPKRLPPPFVTKVALITSSSSDIEADIYKNIGIKPDKIVLHKLGSAAEMVSAYRDLDASGLYDVICFFRGGHEDLSMLVFDDIGLIEAVMGGNTFTEAAIGHEVDKPILSELVDRSTSTPSAFAKTINASNDAFIELVEDAKKASVTSLGLIYRLQGEYAYSVRSAGISALQRIYRGQSDSVDVIRKSTMGSLCMLYRGQRELIGRVWQKASQLSAQCFDKAEQAKVAQRALRDSEYRAKKKLVAVIVAAIVALVFMYLLLKR